MHHRLTRHRTLLCALILAAAIGGTLSLALAAPSSKPTRTVASAASVGFSCPGRLDRATAVTTPSDPDVIAALAVLRRPAAPADTPDARAIRTAYEGQGLHVGDARLLRADARGRAWIVPVDDVRPPPTPERCIAHAPTQIRPALERERRRYAAQPPRPGVEIVSDGQVDIGPSQAELNTIKAGQAIETNSCAGDSHDLLGLYALLPDGATEPYLRFPDGHTVLGDLRDNAVTFLIAKPDRRDQLPVALSWTEASGHLHTSKLSGGGFALQRCVAPPRFVISRAVTRGGDVEAVARGEVPDTTLDALAVKVHKQRGQTCPTIGLLAADGSLGRHVATYCTTTPLSRRERFIVNPQRPERISGRALLAGLADPATVRWIELETRGAAFLVRPSRSGAFFVAYPDSQPSGRKWRVRAALRGPRPIRFTAYRTIVLGPTTPAIAPAGAAKTINPVLISGFAVFRRPRRPSDVLPRRPTAEVFHFGDTNPQHSRLLGIFHGSRFFAIPGGRDLCLNQYNDTGSGGGCGTATINADPATPIGGSSVGPKGVVLVHALLPDGIDRVHVERDDGTRFTIPVRGNFFALRSSRRLHRVWWTTPAGKTASLPGVSHLRGRPRA